MNKEVKIRIYTEKNIYNKVYIYNNIYSQNQVSMEFRPLCHKVGVIKLNDIVFKRTNLVRVWSTN